MTDLPDGMWQTHVYGLLVHPATLSVLMLPDETGWSLPWVRLEGQVWFGEVGPINRAIQQQLNLYTTVMCQLNYSEDKVNQRIEGIYVLENHNPGQEWPLRGRWVGVETLVELTLTVPKQRQVIETYLAEIAHSSIPTLRPAWMQHGWFDEAELWIRTQLAQLGYTLMEPPIEQFSHWGLACILCAHTSIGDIYFKVASRQALFTPEPPLLKGLALFYPDHVPTLLAVDAERDWMLLADFGQPLEWQAPITVHQEILRLLAQMQIASAPRVNELLALGCSDRRLEKLETQIDALINDADTLAGLEEAEIDQLRAFAPHLKARCAQLAGYGVPQTLVHGDLHLGNVAYSRGNYLFFDWTDASVAHPFFDTISIFYKEDATIQAHLRDAYLAPWVVFEPMERLLEIWELAWPLCALHQVISYQHIVANLEGPSQQDMADGLLDWLRKLLKCLS